MHDHARQSWFQRSWRVFSCHFFTSGMAASAAIGGSPVPHDLLPRVFLWRFTSLKSLIAFLLHYSLPRQAVPRRGLRLWLSDFR